MESIEFNTVIGADGIIRAPSGTILPAGAVQVIVRPEVPTEVENSESGLTFGWLLPLAQTLEGIEAKLPSDLAIQHDHYAHGKPKS